VLWDYYADLESADNQGFTPLVISAQQGNLSAVKFLTEKNVNTETVTFENLNAFDYALLNSNTDAAKYLLSINPKLNHKINDKISSEDIALFNNIFSEIFPDKKIDSNELNNKKSKLKKKYFNFAKKNIPLEIF